MRHRLLILLLALATATSAPAAGTYLVENRGEATVARTLERLGIPDPSICHPDETVLRDFVLSRDIPSLVRNHVGAHSTFIYSLPPADRDAWLALFADGSWSNAPGAPEGIQAFVPPSRSFTNYVADAGGKLLLSESLADLQATLAVLPDLPATLPAEGDLVFQFTGNEFATIFDSPLPSSSPGIREGLATLTAGLGIDGDTSACHIVVTPVPGTKLDTYLRSCGPIPPSTACVNLPGAIAFLAIGPYAGGSASSFDFPTPIDPICDALDPYFDAQPVSAALYPPAFPRDLPRALAFFGLNDLPDARTAFHSFLARHSDAITRHDQSYRGIDIDTLFIGDAQAFADLLSSWLHIPGGGGKIDRDTIAGYAWRRASLSLVWLPDGLLVAFGNDDGCTLLPPAIDAALDGTATPFESTPAFRAAYPSPDAHAHAIAHLDLPAILDLLPWKLEFQDEPLPSPCPIDLFACIASDSSLVTRLRAPATLLKSINHGSISSGSADVPPALGGSVARPPVVAENAPIPPASSGGSGAEPPSLATPLPPTPFRGYPEAYVLHNDRIHAVIVPAISRLAFLAPSADAPNLLRFDDALADAGALPPAPSTAPDFFNIGGDWVWPVLQTRWPAFTVDGHPYGHDWPPPPALADGPSDAEAWVDKEGNRRVRLARHYPSPVHATLVREFILAPDGNVLECKQSLTRDPSPCVDETPLPIALWHISQVANPNAIHIPVDSPDFVPTVMSGTLLPDSFRVKTRYFMLGHESTATYTPLPDSEVKLFLPDTPLGATTPNGEFSVRVETQPRPDETLEIGEHDITITARICPPNHTELYSNPGLGYAELETVTSDSCPPQGSLSNILIYHVAPPAP